MVRTFREQAVARQESLSFDWLGRTFLVRCDLSTLAGWLPEAQDAYYHT